MKKKLTFGGVLLLLLLAVLIYFLLPTPEPAPAISLDQVPSYSGEPFSILNGNIPLFTEEDITDESYEYYGDLDALNRCTITMASIGLHICLPQRMKTDDSIQSSQKFRCKVCLKSLLHLTFLALWTKA